MIEILKVLACMPFLLYACYADIKTRRVANEVWVMMFGVGFIFIVYDLMTYGFPYLIRNILSFIFIFAFVYMLFQFGAFGGADAKVLMVISLIIPTYPLITIGSTSLPLDGVPLINLFAFSVFGNSIILTIIVPIGLFLYNLIKNPSESLKRPLYMFIGYITPISKLEKGHFRMIESYSRTKAGIEFKFSRSGTELTSNVISELKGYQKEGKVKDGVWITPGLPFMIPITAGFITAVVFGDLIFYLTIQFMMM
ncbi:A24 family peptidase C-terminal domain-containing protein [Methanolobus mangrovi]|uniref:A24 family peptidase C-terminal domain-containing protein n=1 Tax=Methanolobus mangrovi TaxID=3072977 RepID=A0AA51YFZ1_9EURY|nr:A24 family peptidase C-terminal domain-containing protein [Methanolobus mangrovi]WMW21436.1 A24 family peptidase C-terminal domain-containing protein [Methanolobus mangrovi]